MVGGAPGSGKTTLARVLAERTALPLIAKDDVKEALADVLGVGDPERSRELGRATFEAMRAVASRSLAAGAAVMLEANFHRERSAPWLRELAAMADTRVVICRTAPIVRRARFANRANERVRHRVHLDREVLDRQWEPNEEFELDLGVPVLGVDTADGYAPDLEAIVRFTTPA